MKNKFKNVELLFKGFMTEQYALLYNLQYTWLNGTFGGKTLPVGGETKFTWKDKVFESLLFQRNVTKICGLKDLNVSLFL